MTPHVTPQRAYERLADRAAVGEMCSGEVVKKLRDWRIDPAESQKILRRLTQERFVDDERYARAYVRDRVVNARWGLLKVRQAMRLKQISNQLIERAIDEELDQDAYLANLAAALRTKARGLSKPLAPADKAKVIRFAASRGYEPSLILEMIDDEEYWRRAD